MKLGWGQIDWWNRLKSSEIHMYTVNWFLADAKASMNYAKQLAIHKSKIETWPLPHATHRKVI